MNINLTFFENHINTFINAVADSFELERSELISLYNETFTEKRNVKDVVSQKSKKSVEEKKTTSSNIKASELTAITKKRIAIMNKCKKPELIVLCEKHGLSAEGKLNELKLRLKNFYIKNNNNSSSSSNDEEEVVEKKPKKNIKADINKTAIGKKINTEKPRLKIIKNEHGNYVLDAAKCLVLDSVTRVVIGIQMKSGKVSTDFKEKHIDLCEKYHLKYNKNLENVVRENNDTEEIEAILKGADDSGGSDSDEDSEGSLELKKEVVKQKPINTKKKEEKPTKKFVKEDESEEETEEEESEKVNKKSLEAKKKEEKKIEDVESEEEESEESEENIARKFSQEKRKAPMSSPKKQKTKNLKKEVVSKGEEEDEEPVDKKFNLKDLIKNKKKSSPVSTPKTPIKSTQKAIPKKQAKNIANIDSSLSESEDDETILPNNAKNQKKVNEDQPSEESLDSGSDEEGEYETESES